MAVQSSYQIDRVARTTSSRNWPFVAFTLALAIPVTALLAFHIVSNHVELWTSRWEILAWIAPLAILNLLDLPTYRGQKLAPDEPLILASCLLFHPLTACLIAFVGAFDIREFRDRSDPLRYIFNRVTVGLGAALTSFATRPWAHSDSFVLIAIAATVALIIWTFANHLMVAIGIVLYFKTSARQAADRLLAGTPFDYAVVLAAWCLLAVLLFFSYRSVGVWALLGFSVLATLTRQVLARSESSVQAQAEVIDQRKVIEYLSERMTEERRDERTLIAAFLHDEVVQPLYQIGLLCSVIEHDLASGRLLELEEDVPSLKVAAYEANDRIREVVSDLRNSALGPNGLESTLRAFVEQLQRSTRVTVSLRTSQHRPLPPVMHLAVYYVCREALLNAVYHAKATVVDAAVIDHGDLLECVVKDDGVGFDPSVPREGHFGLAMMRERARAAGGEVHIDSALGEGTVVRLLVPVEGAANDLGSP